MCIHSLLLSSFPTFSFSAYLPLGPTSFLSQPAIHSPSIFRSPKPKARIVYHSPSGTTAATARLPDVRHSRVVTHDSRMANVTPGEDRGIGSTLTLQLYPSLPLLIDYGLLPSSELRDVERGPIYPHIKVDGRTVKISRAVTVQFENWAWRVVLAR